MTDTLVSIFGQHGPLATAAAAAATAAAVAEFVDGDKLGLQILILTLLRLPLAALP